MVRKEQRTREESTMMARDSETDEAPNQGGVRIGLVSGLKQRAELGRAVGDPPQDPPLL